MHARAEDLLKLGELPELVPPPGVWEHVLEGVGARTAARRFRRRCAVAAAVIVVLVTGAVEIPRCSGTSVVGIVSS